MSKYYVNKFLFTVDRDPELLRRYKEEPEAFVATWEQSIGPRLNDAERSSVHALSEAERNALVEHDFVKLFEMGAHFFLSLTLYIAIYDEEWMEREGPLAFQRHFAAQLAHWEGKDYPHVGC